MPTVGAGRDEAVSDVGENSYICRVMADYVNIHTHRPTGRCTELRTAGIHPWEAARELAAVRSEGLAGRLGVALAGAQALGETGLDFACSTDPRRRRSCCAPTCGWPANGALRWCCTACGPSNR